MITHPIPGFASADSGILAKLQQVQSPAAFFSSLLITALVSHKWGAYGYTLHIFQVL